MSDKDIIAFDPTQLPAEVVAEDLVLFQDDVLVVVDLDLGAGVLSEDHLVSDLDLERHSLALFQPARADGQSARRFR